MVVVSRCGDGNYSTIAARGVMDLSLDRRTVSRHLNRLVDLGLAERNERSLDVGGQEHAFSPVSVDEARTRPRLGFFTWVADATDLLEEVGRAKLETIGETESPPDPEGNHWDDE